MRITADELAGPHAEWCHVSHSDCCGGECDCGRVERMWAITDALTAEYERGKADGLDS